MTYYLFMDESINEESFALTGLVVPLKEYARIRDTFYHELKPFLIEPNPSAAIYASPLELKGSSLLPWLEDDQKVEAVHKVVDLTVSNGLRIYRVGSRAKREFQRIFPNGHADMVSVCWVYMTRAIADLLRQGLVIPVMDLGCPRQGSRMARFVASMNAARQTKLRESISVPHSENLGELLFADSESSSMTQLVDLIAWLRNVSDKAICDGNLSEFKQRMLPLAKQLDGCMVYEESDRIP